MTGDHAEFYALLRKPAKMGTTPKGRDLGN